MPRTPPIDAIAMAKKVCSRRELLDRWRRIEEEDDSDQLRQLKQQWFSDTFNFLICLENDIHVWCASWDLMGPLLEAFYNYFKDERVNSPLKVLWGRISQEMRQCTQCICQHHQAQELYRVEYESSYIGPLLNVLRILDEKRVTQHLKEINARSVQGELDSDVYNAEVVTLMFEVLMYPALLDDQSLVTEFQTFIEAVDDSHDLTLAGHQQYPGVYALLFLKSSKVRSIGLRLAGYHGKLRSATDMEPLQPLLKKCISYLETEILPSVTETSRPRVQLGRINVWIGIKNFLGFLEPPAFEEGILERHPIFLTIVLNHVSDDSLEFTYAVHCLRLLFEMLGCKLWLRTTLSPGVMRNTLMGQCFHTRNEKSHKEIFNLFQPFLQSLEALQDGEHEKQRRPFLYFLFHQVQTSCNFSVLMRKKACQIALFIIHRGYKMSPPSPPFECAHIWGPSLISSLRDSSLHDSQRQPAFDLIHTILISDCAALVASLIGCSTHESVGSSTTADFNDDDDDDDDDDEITFSNEVEEKDSSCWNEFSIQSKLIARECKGWMCIPMLWFEVLVETNISVFPVSFSKAVLWALSRFSMIELESSMNLEFSIRDWLSSYAGNISFMWEVPTGSDDGSDEKVSKNSNEVSSTRIPLVQIFKRLTAEFVIQMEQGKLWQLWTWEPRMSESLVLLLIDPNDSVRQVGRIIIEHVSKTHGLALGLQFLCSRGSSLSAVYLGLIHALKLVQFYFTLSNFHKLHHFFFVLGKILKEMAASSQEILGSQVDGSNFSSQRVFLQQPVFNAFPISFTDSQSVDPKAQERFNDLVSEHSWPSLTKCLAGGKEYIDDKNSQMTCIRVLEILPIVFERLCLSFHKLPWSENGVFDLQWLHDLVDWGKSPQASVTRYWIQSFTAVLGLLKNLSRHSSASTFRAIEALISSDDVVVDELKKHVSQLSISLSSEAGIHSSQADGTVLESFPSARKVSGCTGLESFVIDSKVSGLDTEPSKVSALDTSSSEDTEVEILDPPSVEVIVLSDDEEEVKLSSKTTVQPCNETIGHLVHSSKLDSSGDKSNSLGEHDALAFSSFSTSKNLTESIQLEDVTKSAEFTPKHEFDASNGQEEPAYPSQSNGIDDSGERIESTCVMKEARLSKLKDHTVQRSSSDGTVLSKKLNQICSTWTSGASVEVAVGTRNNVVKELVDDIENDPWERAVKASQRSHWLQTKAGPSVCKRQVVQLDVPGENKSGTFRLDTGGKRLKPPRLDDWYRPILEMDYFSAVGLSSENEDENASVTKLKEVPVCFESSDHYVDIFRPLVLEEFKAQLHSSFVEAPLSEEMCCGSFSVFSVERVDDFHLIRCAPSDNDYAGSRGCSENDLVLLTKNPLVNSAHDIHMIGKVERREKDNMRRPSILVIRFYLQNGSSRLNKAKRFLTERSKWYINRIMSITPQLREFQALSSMNEIPMLPLILKPTMHPPADAEANRVQFGKLSQPLQQAFKSSFNDSQLQAISAAIGTHGSESDFELSLIQGPPGTGKTRTIVAIVSGLLSLLPQRMNDAEKLQNCSLRHSDTSISNTRPQISQSAAIASAWQEAAVARQLNEDGEKSSNLANNSRRARVLICAQSNAAVDELVSRISSEGLYGTDGDSYKPYLVRVGNARTLHPSSLPYFIDTLVDQRLAEEKMNVYDAKSDLMEDSMTLRSTLENLVDRIRFYEAKRANIRDGNPDSKRSPEGASNEDDVDDTSVAAVTAKLNQLYQQKREICKELSFAQGRERKLSEESKALKYVLRKTILREAEIVVTTLSGSGGDLYGVCAESFSNYKFGSSSELTLFDAVVIDEAAQALEPATLIPLQLLKSCRTKCIMVGDPKQLPATVLSHVASKFLYECSMFERLQRAGHPVIMLSKQYRMHPEICKFPSLHFYDSKLLNGDDMISKVAPFHKIKYLGPYLFFDVIDGRESHGKNSSAMSLYNECEVSVAVELLKLFSKRYPSEFVGGRIGIISPYKSQVSLMRTRFSSVFGTKAITDIEFNTVDGFQGREVDILILSTVRATDPSSITGIKSSIIGFVADVRRMNVALTRAKLSLWILGNANTLRTDQNWAALIRNAKERNLVKTMAKPYESMFKKYYSASRKRARSSGSCSEPLESDEKVRDTSKCLDQVVGSVNDTARRKKETVKNDVGRCAKKGKLMNANVPDDGPSKDTDPTQKMKLVEKDRGKEKVVDEKLAILSSTLNSGTVEVICEKPGVETKVVEEELEVSKIPLNHSMSKGESSENAEKCRTGIALSCTESNLQVQETNEGCKTLGSGNSPKALITTKKQQCDAVDALLPSPLVSSKKPELSASKSMKKRRSATAKAANKPTKRRKDPSLMPSTALQDTASIPGPSQTDTAN